MFRIAPFLPFQGRSNSCSPFHHCGSLEACSVSDEPALILLPLIVLANPIFPSVGKIFFASALPDSVLVIALFAPAPEMLSSVG